VNLSLTLILLSTGVGDEPGAVDFNRDIRPILAEKCIVCHGPDEEVREADLRLDQSADVYEDRDGTTLVVPGDRGLSELFLRITDSDDPMPPTDFDQSLASAEIEIIGRWIEGGADWQKHWAYEAPTLSDAPVLAQADWVRDPLDRWILARLEQEALPPAPEATREALLRRVTLDLTGLPPTLVELDAYLADGETGAYERVVDRLLASNRYGENMARYWLDAARYGDTHGFHLDNVRSLWRWRDWVIDAFNDNKPFDAFTVEQLAGDLLLDPSLEQLIATGFNRCNPTTGEGGLIREEYLAKYAVDRAETTSTIFLGTTIGCANCHDHKFDPFTTTDFYGLFAFFHSFAEDGSDYNALAPPPSIKAPTQEQAAQLEALLPRVTTAAAAMVAPDPELDAGQASWERDWAEKLSQRWHGLAPLSVTSRGGATMEILEDSSILVSGKSAVTDVFEVLVQTDAEVVTAIHLEALPHPSFANGGVGRSDNANIVLTNFSVEVVPQGRTAEYTPIALSGAYADFSQPAYPVIDAIDPDPAKGWGVHHRESEEHRATFLLAEPLRTEGGAILRIRLHFESQHQRHVLGNFRLSVSTQVPAPTVIGSWYALGPFQAENANAAYDQDFGPEAHSESGVDLDATFGAGLAWGERAEYVDGQPHQFVGDYSAVYLSRVIEAPTDRRMMLEIGSDAALKVWFNGKLVLDRNVRRELNQGQDMLTIELQSGKTSVLMKVVNDEGPFSFTFRVTGEELFTPPLEIAGAVSAPAGGRSPAQTALLMKEYRGEFSPRYNELLKLHSELEAQRVALEAAIPSTMITRDLEEPRPTHILIRGEYDNPGPEVIPGVPAILPPLPPLNPGERPNRLALARWLTRPDHPLTARVTVNRFWQQIFGTGLVDTPTDFGTRGSWPTHPELLDDLAVDFVQSGWNVKGLMRRFVTSAAYRQASRITPEKLERDPRNALLSRGPRQRLDAETIRDSALFMSGLLVERIGGPSVKPYQPSGLWNVVGYSGSNTVRFVQDSGDKLYRRSMYTFWKRTSPPPTMAIFDAPTREACVVSRARTNTPLQALALMNDVQFVEAARCFAERVLLESGEDIDDRLIFAFRAATSRLPDAGELDILRTTFGEQLASFEADGDSALALISVGESPIGTQFDVAELAAWTMLTNLILNLDEVVTRG
jgi:hypothetical protein